MKHIFYIVLFLCSYNVALAQLNYSAYTDIQNRFYLFDNGEKVQLEGVLPQEYQIGRTGLAYKDNMGIFKIYRYGNKNVINDIFTSEFKVTDNLIVYKGANSLNVIDGDEDKILTSLVGEYAVGDSVVLYFDKVRNMLHAYYNGEIFDLESNLANTNFNNFIAQDNVIAYVNFMGQLKVFYQGNIEVLETQKITNLQVGRNTLAYLDINGQFKIWHKGVVQTVDGFAPKNFKVGDNVVAYTAYDGNFKICYNGNVSTIGFFEKNYIVNDHVVCYEDGAGFFNIFYKGNTTMMDNFWPSKIVSNYNSAAYINKANMLRMFNTGAVQEVTALVKDVEEVRLDYDLLRYKVGLNMYRFVVDGKEY